MTPVKLDRTDLRILQALQTDGSISNLELAEQVGLSPSPCSRRVRQLREMGLVDGCVTLLNQHRLGLELMIFVQVSLEMQSPERLESFEANVTSWPEVMECYLIAGGDADFTLKVVVPSLAHYQQWLLERLNRIKGVQNIRSSFVLRQVRHKTALPLEHLGG